LFTELLDIFSVKEYPSCKKLVSNVQRRFIILPNPTLVSAKTDSNTYVTGVVPWLRSLVAGLSPLNPEFAPGSIHVGFLVDKVALGKVFLRVLRFSPVNIIPPSFSELIYRPGDE
jgi:hypothetical protein